jgi:predicted RNA polymerase sigma factor
MTAAKHRAIDGFRRNRLRDRKHEELGYELELEQETTQPDLDAALDDQVGDDLLRLVFISCHPILSPEARAALTLRLIGGLTTEEIARAFLVPDATIQQRIVRAKRMLSDSGVKFEVPRGPELDARLSSVLSVIYLIFNEGYSATAGEDWMRPQLCAEALRLGRIVAELAREEPEVHGLVALMEIQASRLGARTGPTGEPVLLLDQDRARWDHLLIRRGLAALARAEALAGTSKRMAGPYRCRPQSRPVTRAPQGLRKPTGHGSSDSMARSPRSPRRRSSTSIARWRWRCCSVRRLASKSSMR